MIWAFKTGYGGNWHPLTWISHMIDCKLYGLNAGGHHMTNVAFHIAASALLFLFLIQMTGAVWRSFFVASLFAWHPLHVESVAWISERKDVLSGCFWMLVILAYGRYVKRPSIQTKSIAIVCYILGLMTKPLLVALPFVLLLLDYWPLGRITDWLSLKKAVLEKTLFFLISGLSSAITFFVQRTEGAVVPLIALSLLRRICNAFVSYVLYVAKLIWPVRLSVVYPYPNNPIESQIVLALSALVVLLLVTWFCLKLARRRPYLLMG